MKTCTKCQKIYTDYNLNFCLEDGSPLAAAGDQTLMPETIVMNDPFSARPQPDPQLSQQTVLSPKPHQVQPNEVQSPKKKSSKTWLWVVGILGVVVFLCGGGLVGVLVWIVSQKDLVSDAVYNAERRGSPTPEPKRSSANTTLDPSTSDRMELTTVDLSKFAQQFSAFGTTIMKGEELEMASLMKGYSFVVVTSDKDDEDVPLEQYKTDNTDSRVTVRNLKDEGSRLGYGIVFHSNPQPLQEDFAFLIDAKHKKYRVVYHKSQKEDIIFNWTPSPAIRGGTAENTLEVRDFPDRFDLYINGTMVTSVHETYGYKGGVVGLYSGDGVKVGFRNLEIRK